MAQAVSNISTGETLLPLYGYCQDDGSFQMSVMPQERLEEGVAEGRKLLDVNPHNTLFAAFVFDGIVTIGENSEERLDALIMEYRIYGDQPQTWSFTLPYLPATPDRPLGIFQLHLTGMPESASDEDIDNNYNAFCEGVGHHEEGSQIWYSSKIVTPANEDSGIYQNAVTNETYQSWQQSNADVDMPIIAEKYDDAAWHVAGEYPQDLPDSAAATHVGMYFAWCYFNNLVNESGSLELHLKKLKSRAMTPGQWVIQYIGGSLTKDLINDKGRAFSDMYYEPKWDYNYYEDLSLYIDTVLSQVESIYHLPDTWENFDALSETIDKRFKEYKETVSKESA